MIETIEKLLSGEKKSTSSEKQLELEYEFLFEMTAFVNAPINIGDSLTGGRTYWSVTGGSFKGPKIEGDVLPEGGDSMLQTDLFTSKLDIRAVLKTTDGDHLYIYYNGIGHVQEDLSIYFRTTPVIETGSKTHDALNRTICVGVGEFIPFTESGQSAVRYKVYGIL